MGDPTDVLTLEPVTDLDGNPVPESEDHLAAADTPLPVKFDYGTRRFMVYIRPLQIPSRLHNRVSIVALRLALAAGFRRDEDMDKIAPDDPRALKLIELQAESEELRRAEAAVCAAAIVNVNGAPLTNCEYFAQNGASETAILESGAIGESMCKAVMSALRPTSPVGAEAEPTKTEASATAF